MSLARSTVLAAAIVATLSASALAEPMSGAEVEAFFKAGAFETEVGSNFDFRPDGSFSVRNSDGSRYAGTWTVDADGRITTKREHAAKDDKFYIEVNAGDRTLVFTSGRFKGRKFRLS